VCGVPGRRAARRRARVAGLATVTDEVLRELARMARLEPSAAEARGADGPAARARDALVTMIEAVETLRAVDVSGVPPYLGGDLPGCPLRADVPGPCLPREQILAAAPAQQDGRISTPRVRND
jgi:aspartyl/glutamyl-tRNA(Asn/Gln) amidotransferase C subunit